ncbi:hypothetical protein N9934_03390 [Desulfosarcina sp.]|nr:hypothetical protein [Desulfosarcina sp.]
MTTKSNFFKCLKERIFPKIKKLDSGQPTNAISETTTQKLIIDTKKNNKSDRDPYFIQIGLDFGTSYCKCVCRDVMTNKSWVYFPNEISDEEIPFLIPSTLLIKNGHVALSNDTTREYHQDGLYHLKIALEKVALNQLNDPVLEIYQKISIDNNIDRIDSFVFNCVVFFLAKTLQNVITDIEKRYHNFGENKDDYLAVNLAIPVENTDKYKVENIFFKALCISWYISKYIKISDLISISDLNLIISNSEDMISSNITEACFIYPEVSANIQGYIRSSVSKEGIYFFSDTGAGTVDQSVFIFFRKNGIEHLTYLYANVMQQGSCYIERKAAEITRDSGWKNLEKWRIKKENGEMTPELTKARFEVEIPLRKGTKCTLNKANQKLKVKKQLYDIRVIFGGGGHINDPYKIAVMNAFRTAFQKNPLPDIVGLPIPKDLEIDGRKNYWMKRLSVAYGLSYVRTELANHIYPSEVSIPKPCEIFSPQSRKILEAPSKDVC